LETDSEDQDKLEDNISPSHARLYTNMR
jgi:hypothetical protein